MKTRAAILTAMQAPPPYATSRPLEIAEVELDPPGPGEVLVQLRAAGLCHSDLSVIDGNRPRPLPMVLGHEAAGEVVEIGKDVRSFAVGDHVVSAFVPSCGHCAPCIASRPALCEPGFAANSAGTLLSGARRLHRGGAALNHHLGVSGFADFAVMAQESVVKIDRSLPFATAAVFGCAVMTGTGAVLNTANLPVDASVAVLGLGGVGLAALLGAKLRQARMIVAIDLSDRKLQLARELGATHCFNAGDADVAARIREVTKGGLEYTFEMAGAVRAMELAWQITRRGGTTVTAGLSHPDAKLTLGHLSIVAEERTLKGSYLGSCVPSRDIPAYIAYYQQGRLPVDRLLAERLTLAEINVGFDRLASGETVRQIVEFS
jgi:alcohol dehydrogenase